MHDARAVLVAAGGPADKPVHERSGRVARRRVDDDPGRLVHDQQLLVLVGDRQRDVLRLQLLRGALDDLDLNLFSALEPVVLRQRSAVDERGTCR
jgi:hypothetical protein